MYPNFLDPHKYTVSWVFSPPPILQMRKLGLREVKQIAKLSVVVKYWHLDSVYSCSLCGQVKKKFRVPVKMAE